MTLVHPQTKPTSESSNFFNQLSAAVRPKKPQIMIGEPSLRKEVRQMTGCTLPTWRLPGAKTCPERTSEYRQRPYDNRLEGCAVDPTRIGCIQVRAVSMTTTVAAARYHYTGCNTVMECMWVGCRPLRNIREPEARPSRYPKSVSGEVRLVLGQSMTAWKYVFKGSMHFWCFRRLVLVEKLIRGSQPVSWSNCYSCWPHKA